MFFAESIQVKRSGGGEYNARGYYTAFPAGTFNLQANVQPLQGTELLILPEGKRNKESLKILTDVQLLETNEKTGALPDVIFWQGRAFEVHSVKNYTQIIPHFESIAINVNHSEGADG